MTKKKAYSYQRFSSGQQAKGDSLIRQGKAASEWAKRNNCDLDEQLTIVDAGVSAWSGKNAATGNLSAFLKAVEEKKVPRGSVLIVENLDRLSRDQEQHALTIFLSIINAGISIVTLQEGRDQTFEHGKLDTQKLMFVIFEFSRAHSESERKSNDGKGKWERRRDAMRSGKTAGNYCPKWLESKKDRSGFVFVPKKLKTVKKIIDLYLNGYGMHLIAEHLNDNDYAPIGHGKRWSSGQVKNVLGNPALIGTKQPMKFEGRKEDRIKVPDGDPILDFFPSVIDQETYDRIQFEINARSVNKGPRRQTTKNLFSALISSDWNGEPINWTLHTGKEGHSTIYCERPKSDKSNKKKYHIPYDVIEETILQHLQEIDTSSFFGRESNQNQIDALQGKIVQLETQLAETEEGLLENYSRALAKVAATLESRIEGLRDELQAILAQQKNITVDRINDLQELIDSLKTTKGEALEALRLKLKAQIKTLLIKIQIEAVAEITNQHKHVTLSLWFRGETRIRYVHLEIKQGKSVRSYWYGEIKIVDNELQLAIVNNEEGVPTAEMVEKFDQGKLSNDKVNKILADHVENLIESGELSEMLHT